MGDGLLGGTPFYPTAWRRMTRTKTPKRIASQRGDTPREIRRYRQLHFGVNGIGHAPGEASLRAQRSGEGGGIAEMVRLAAEAVAAGKSFARCVPPPPLPKKKGTKKKPTKFFLKFCTKRPRYHVGSVPVRLSESGLAPGGKSSTALMSDVPWVD